MKTILSFLLLIVLTVSCQMKQKENAEVAEEHTETNVADSIKASAIFWVDKAEIENREEYRFRTVKAKVFIHEDGKVDLQAYINKQPKDVDKYLRDHLSKFKVSEKMFESGYVQPGEKIVQLLYGIRK